MSDKQYQPWSPESEAGVIGALLLDNDALDNVADILTTDSFFDDRAGIVYAAISRLVMAGKPADVLTVATEVASSGVDLATVHTFSQAAASARHARAYAQVVADKAMSRRLLSAADDVKAVSFDFGLPTADRISKAQALLESLQNHSTKSQPQAIQNFVEGAMQRIQDIADGKNQPGIATRIPFIDRSIGGGLKPGKLMILAARPSVGKSSFAQQICINVAQDGHPCAMFSMEMSGQEMTDRAICNLGRIDMEHYNTGDLETDDYSRMTEALERLRNMRIFLDEQPAMSLPEIAAKARHLVRKQGIKLLVIDYLQLCATTNPKLSRHHQLEEISRGLKALAKQLDITIIALSQLNREIEKRTSGRPQMSDLKESGAIEEDADVVMLMWKHKQEEGCRLTGLDLAKVRGGRTGAFCLHFEGAYQRWGQSAVSLSETSMQQPASKYQADL